MQFFAKSRAIKLLIDPETGRIVDANQSALDFYGYSSAEFKNLKISDINTLSQKSKRGNGECYPGEKILF